MRVTKNLILLSIIFTLITWVRPSSTHLLAYNAQNLLQGREWTLITALFVHANLLHLAGNMLFLYVFAGILEDEIGSIKTLAAFLTGGIISFLLSTPLYPNTNMVGASAAIFTLTAIAMFTRPLRFSLLFLSPVGLIAALYFLYNIIAIQQKLHDGIAYEAHIIGFLTGTVLGVKMNPEWKKNLTITLLLLGLYALIGYLIFI
jgi:membrane associated rhomboid family serine protease